MNSIQELISKFGFPIVATMGLGYFIYFIWNWVTKEVKPLLSSASKMLIGLIDRTRMLDNDLIRLTQKLRTFVSLSEKK